MLPFAPVWSHCCGWTGEIMPQQQKNCAEVLDKMVLTGKIPFPPITIRNANNCNKDQLQCSMKTIYIQKNSILYANNSKKEGQLQLSMQLNIQKTSCNSVCR